MAKKPLKPTEFKNGWRRQLADSDAPITLPRPPWETAKESDDDRKPA